MLSDEEKQAIKVLNHFNPVDCGREDTQAIETILNLIEKQQKEIEELKEQCKEVVCIPEGTCFMLEPKDINKKWKDKIKEILGIEEDIDNEKLLSLLQTIVDENVRLEEIEDRKVQIEYNNVFNKGVKSVEDKIKAKIEEVEQWELYNMKIPRLSTLDERLGAKIGIKYVLQSLLEKEGE